MMKKKLLILAILVSSVLSRSENSQSYADFMNKIVNSVEDYVLLFDYHVPVKKTASFKMQTLVGEAAVNNILQFYFVGKHVIPVESLDNVTISLDVKKIGIDVQGVDDVVLGYEMVLNLNMDTQGFANNILGNSIPSNVLDELLNNSGKNLSGDIMLKNAISLKKLNESCVALLNLNGAIDEIFNLYGIKNSAIIASIKDFFARSNGAVELWRQQYGDLLKAYVSNNEMISDFIIKNDKLDIAVGKVDDNIEIDLELELETERQYFWYEDINQEFSIVLRSNKVFKVLKVGTCEINSSNYDTSYIVNYFDVCNILFPSVIKVKAKHGGILELKF